MTTVTPLAPFGAEITGCDIPALSPAQAREVAVLIARSRVAVFRAQPLDDVQLVDFLRKLGELTFTDGETPVDGAPDLNLVSNAGRTTPPRSVFHSDTSYVARPPSFTALRPVTLPKNGGATVFSDQVDAASRLPHRHRTWLAGRTVLHSASGVARHEAVRHPLFRRHPLTNEVALYLSTPARCSDLSGVGSADGARVLDLLYRRSIKAAGLYAHQWQPGDLLIWDNRVTMHRADHDGVASERTLHRGMVRGEVPVAA